MLYQRSMYTYNMHALIFFDHALREDLSSGFSWSLLYQCSFFSNNDDQHPLKALVTQFKKRINICLHYSIDWVLLKISF
jgi:hypothetical protein